MHRSIPFVIRAVCSVNYKLMTHSAIVCGRAQAILEFKGFGAAALMSHNVECRRAICRLEMA
jgi:hypothetical protein